MADIDLKTETPDTTLPATGFLFGADSQASASPSVYSTQAVATTLLGSTTLTGASAIATSQPLLDLSQTWNASGVTFTGAKLNITDTASNAASLLMDLGTGGGSFVSRFSVSKAGGVTGSSFRQTSSGAGIQVDANSSRLLLHSNNAALAYGDGSNLTLGATIRLNWSPADAAIGSNDTTLRRRAAANLALGAADAAASATVTITIATPGVVTWSNHGLSTGTPVIFSTTGALPTGITAGTTYYAIVVDANTIRIATSLANALAGTAVNTSGSQSGTQTGSRGAIAQTSSVQSVVAGTTNFPGADKIITGSQGTGTGAGGSLIFQVAPAGSSGSAQNALATALTINSAQQLLVNVGSAAAPSISFSGNTNTGIFSTGSNNINFSTGSVERFRMGSGGRFAAADGMGFGQNTAVPFSVMTSSGYGVVEFSPGSGSDTRICLGGTTSSFPAIKRSTTFLQARLADDSAFAGFASANMQAATAYTVATLPGTPGTGMIARVTDALAPTIGTTVASGGAAYALVNYNGANWTVIGV